MPNKALITVIAFVICVGIIALLILWVKNLRTALKTLNVEHDILRNKYNGLQQTYAEYQYAMQHKEELHAQTQQQLADIATADDATVIEQLQNRSNRVHNEDSSS